MRERKFIVIEGGDLPPQQQPRPGARMSRRARGAGVEAAPSAAPTAGQTSAGPEPLKVHAETMTEQQAADQRRDPRTRMVVEPMPIMLIQPFASDTASPAASGDSWGIAATGADQSARDGAGVTVAVLDTGIDIDHPAFAGIADRIETKDFTDSSTGAHDVNGHGTHCAGTVFGQDVDGKRIGVARSVEKALIAKVLSDEGPNETTYLFDAMNWANREGAQIVSMSLGFDYPGMVKRLIEWYDMPANVAASQALVAFAGNLRAFDAIMEFIRAQATFQRDTLVVAASGNESDRRSGPQHVISASMPGAAEGIVSVGAYAKTGDTYKVADFSNIDAQIAAPGVDIVSARSGGGLTAMSGTSMACPHVAGVAALWWQELRENGQTPTSQKVSENMFTSATRHRLPEPYSEAEYGRGRVMAP